LILPVISIITACYNKASFILETIESVQQQTYKNWELIIIDDASSDYSKEIISKYLFDKRIQLIANKQNKGANYSRNLGIKTARGKYVFFLDADDLMT